MAENLIPDIESGQGPAAQGAPRLGGAPDYRQIQNPTPGLEPWRLPDSGAAARAEALANTFKTFEGEASTLSDHLATQAGHKVGAAAGMSPSFQPKTGLQAITAYGEAYNSAAHLTYVTQSQLALEQQLTDLEKANVGNPDAFATQAGAAAQAAIKNMAPIYVPEMTNWAQSRIQAGVNRQSNQKADDVRNTALATYQSSTPDLITAALHTAAALPGAQGDAVISKLVSDDQDRVNALVASRTITAEQAVALHQKMVDSAHGQMTGQRVDLSLQPVLQAMRSNVEAADKLIIQPDENLTAEENQVRQAEYEKERSAYVQSQTRARADDLNATHQALAAGSYGSGIEGQIHTLYKQGALSEEGYFAATAEAIRNQKGALQDDASLQLVDAAVHGTGPRLDPKDSAAQAAADKYFQAHVAIANASPTQYAIGAAEFVKQVGIVPASVQSNIRVGLLSGDAQQTAQAAALAAKIQAQNPEADVYKGTPRLAALAGLVNDNLNAGLAPAQALAVARTAVDIPEGQRKVRDARYGQDVKASNDTNQVALQKLLQDKDGSTFGANAPRAPIGMQASYDSLVRQMYDQTGDIGKAREIAGAQLRQSWRVTHVNGTAEYMQYGVRDADVPAVRADIASSVKAAGYTGDPSTVHLTPNESTVASGGRSWTLTHVNASGANDVLLDAQNRPLRYDVPSGQDFAKAQAALASSKIDQARKLRDQDRQNSADVNQYEQQLANQILQGNPQQRQMAGR